MASACRGVFAWAFTSSSQVCLRSSIIAHISPRGVSPACAKSAGSMRVSSLPRAFSPSELASRRAGSMVNTSARWPSMAARRASAAAVVVLPTPPEPTQQITL